MNSAPEFHPAFRHERSRTIDHLNLTVHEFEHINTGAKHFHLAMDHDESVFMVAFRTVPMDSTGVAHVLEHTALCGSEKYPVRDPFFLMIRRSLNTFMNAFTSSDYTAYPFASQNARDFNNLLDIYLDAVFFANLDRLDFAQEGHRIEFEVPDDPTTPLTYRGVVFNEMKGDTSSPVSVLYDELKKQLFPTTTYHYNSGGDPACIPDLTYEQLVDFYRTHYHPSNAIFMTFGGDSPKDLQEKFECQALHRFERLGTTIAVGPEQPLNDTVRVAVPYASDDADVSEKTHVVMGWKLGPNTDLGLLLRCNLLADVLLDTSASPLREALEQTDLGRAPSPLCGLEESNHEMSFYCGLEGCRADSADQVETLINDTLMECVQTGIAVDRIEACLHQLELSHREIGGDGSPYGLQLIFSCMSAAVHRGDPIELLDLDPVIESLRQEIAEPDFLARLIRELLLENRHCVRVEMYPDTGLQERVQQVERTKLDGLKQELSDAEVAELVETAAALAARQAREEPVELLPKVGLNDIPETLHVPEGSQQKFAGGTALTRYQAGTNGLTYHQIVATLPTLSERQLSLLQTYTQVITEIGSAGRSFRETQHLQHSFTGGISVYTSARASFEDDADIRGHVTYSSRCLNRNVKTMMQIVRDTCFSPNFDEPDRVADLVRQARVRRESSLTSNGHGLVMMAASAFHRPVSRLNHYLSGLEGTLRLKQLDDSVVAGMDQLVEDLGSITSALEASRHQLLLIAEAGSIEDSTGVLSELWSEVPGQAAGKVNVPFAAPDRHQAWITTTQVNFCASAYSTVSETHEDSAALAVLSAVLRNGFLHRVVREQGGAYGGGATHDSANGVFRFYSYRDPRLQETFAAFEEAVHWIGTTDISFDLVEEAILGIISSIDAPASPAGEARQAFQSELLGRDRDHRVRYRQRVLKVDIDDVKRVAETYLHANPSRAVLTNRESAETLPGEFSQKVI